MKTLKIGPTEFEWGARTVVMGILNATPDSFSGDGFYPPPPAPGEIERRALAQARRFLAAGAEILDVGGESTRPGAQPVSADEELERVIPTICALAAEFPEVVISIDCPTTTSIRRFDQPLDPDLDISVVRLDPDLPLPSYAHPGDAGADLHTTIDVTLAPGERALVPTGLVDRAARRLRRARAPALRARCPTRPVDRQHPWTVDAGYRGEIKVAAHQPRPARVGDPRARGPDRPAGRAAVRAGAVRRGGGAPRLATRRRGLRFYRYRFASMSRNLLGSIDKEC